MTARAICGDDAGLFEKQEMPVTSTMNGTTTANRIRVGVGGWTFEPWRNNFYPAGLAQSRELEYASRKLSAIEINGTFYGSQKPASFAKWRDETPDDFVFSMKATRYATNRKVLAEAGDSIDRFVKSGIAELRGKLGPILWQFASTKKFEPADFEGFLKLLPGEVDSLPLRHVLDVRHASFMTTEYLDMARHYRCATVFTDSDDYPSFADVTGEFVYARLMRTDAALPSGFEPPVLDAYAGCARAWASGAEPAGLPRVAPPSPGATAPRDVFIYFISGGKEKAPAAAMALRERVG
jgi:uncharacterized protein YecE (DUF72 family)